MYLPSLLFILCLCLSFCVCSHVRPLGAVDHHNVSGKVEENVKKHVAESEGELGTKVKANVRERSVSVKDVKRSKEEEEEDISGVAQIRLRSVVSISWRVPHHKKQDHHPGFYSDYSQPRTRPPSHN